MLTPLLLAFVVGYILGSLPFGYLVARAKGVNIFEVGSKSPGATNVRRVLGSGYGNLVLVLDAAKGAAATFAPWCWRIAHAPHSHQFGSEEYGYFALAGLVGAILGHSFSCFTKFRGGKSVATGAGGFAVLFPPGAGIALVVWCAAAALTRYVSVASMLAAVALPVAAYFMDRSLLLVGVSAIIAAFVVIRHRANISRLLSGTENKIGGGKSAAPKP